MSMMNALRRLAPAPVSAQGKTPKMAERFSRPGVKAESWQVQVNPKQRALSQSRPAVGTSEDFKRVFALDRRPTVDIDGPEGLALADVVTARHTNGATSCDCRSVLGRPCLKHLKPAQAWALDEIRQHKGLLGPIGVGHGKSLLNLLAPMAFEDCKLAVLLVPPSLQDQLGREYDAASRHFVLPNLNLHGNIRGKLVVGRPVIHVIPYSRFSRADATTMLDRLRPDVIIADEAHKLRHPNTATTSRVLRYFADQPETRFCGWSGTLTARSLRDYAHLSAIALKGGSPLPLSPNIAEEWSLAIDPLNHNSPPGVLYDFCEPGEHVREGFSRRLHATAGVVGTKAAACDASLVIEEKKAPPVPAAIKDALDEVRRTAVRPDGEELIDQMQVVECARQISLGFYYRWRFPKEIPEATIYAWFEARKAWARELRRKLETREEHMDSPLLCRNAAERAWLPKKYEGGLPVWKADTWPAWRDIQHSVRHYTEAVWVDDYLARDAAAWAKKNKGLVWCYDQAFGQKVAELSGLPYYDGRADSPKIVEKDADDVETWSEDGKRSVILSVRRYGTGTDGLQHRFNTQLVAAPPSSGDAWEQMLGRLHRTGQEESDVTAIVYRHTEEMAGAVDKAVREAKYIEETMGTHQKLLSATVQFDVTEKKVA